MFTHSFFFLRGILKDNHTQTTPAAPGEQRKPYLRLHEGRKEIWFHAFSTSLSHLLTYAKHLLACRACLQQDPGHRGDQKQESAGGCITNSHCLEGLRLLSYRNANKQTHTLDLCPIQVPQVPRSPGFIHLHIWDLCNVDQNVSALLKNEQ